MDHQQTVFVARLRALLELLPPALDRRVAQADITSYEFALLDAIDDAPDGRLRLSDLARSTHATLPRLSRVVSALERKGMARRIPSTEDRRVTEACLTAVGRDVLTAARPLLDEALHGLVLDQLSPGDLDRASSALAAILGALDPDGSLAVLSRPPADGD